MAIQTWLLFTHLAIFTHVYACLIIISIIINIWHVLCYEALIASCLPSSNPASITINLLVITISQRLYTCSYSARYMDTFYLCVIYNRVIITHLLSNWLLFIHRTLVLLIQRVKYKQCVISDGYAIMNMHSKK